MRGGHSVSRAFACCEFNWTCTIGAGTSPVPRCVWTKWAKRNNWSGMTRAAFESRRKGQPAAINGQSLELRLHK